MTNTAWLSSKRLVSYRTPSLPCSSPRKVQPVPRNLNSKRCPLATSTRVSGMARGAASTDLAEEAGGTGRTGEAPGEGRDSGLGVAIPGFCSSAGSGRGIAAAGALGETGGATGALASGGLGAGTVGAATGGGKGSGSTGRTGSGIGSTMAGLSGNRERTVMSTGKGTVGAVPS